MAARKKTPQIDLREVSLPAKKLLTVLANAPIWDSIRLGHAMKLPVKKDSVLAVRVFPPVDATEEQVTAVRSLFEQLGARVRLMPRERGANPVPAQQREKVQRSSVREVVLALAEKNEGAKSILEEAMEEVGL